MAPSNNIDKNLFRTIAGQIAMNLDKNAQNVRDGKIEISVWKDFWDNGKGSEMDNANKSKGQFETNETKDKTETDTISVQDAMKLIMTRLYNAAKAAGATNLAAKATELGNKLFKAMNGTIFKESDGVTTTPAQEEDGEDKGISNENQDVDNKENLLKEKRKEAIGEEKLPDGVTAELNEDGEVVFKQGDKIISAEDVKNMIEAQNATDKPIVAEGDEGTDDIDTDDNSSEPKTPQEILTDNGYTDVKPEDERFIDNETKAYYKCKTSDGKTVRVVVENGKVVPLVVISDSLITNKKFATVDKVKEVFGDDAKDLPENFELPSGIEGKFNKEGKLVFYRTIDGKAVSASVVANKIKSKAAKRAGKAEAKNEKNAAKEKAKEYESRAKDGIVEVKKRNINATEQYYAVYTDKKTNNTVRKTLDENGDDLVTIKGGGIGFEKREFVTLSALREAAEQAGIENAEKLTKIPDGYECNWDSKNNRLSLTKKENKQTKTSVSLNNFPTDENEIQNFIMSIRTGITSSDNEYASTMYDSSQSDLPAFEEIPEQKAKKMGFTYGKQQQPSKQVYNVFIKSLAMNIEKYKKFTQIPEEQRTEKQKQLIKNVEKNVKELSDAIKTE